jgi:hypothetical protein
MGVNDKFHKLDSTTVASCSFFVPTSAMGDYIVCKPTKGVA